MRFVFHSFCGMPLRAGAILIGLFTTVISAIAFGELVSKLLNGDISQAFTTKEEWLHHMAVKTSLSFFLLMVCLMQLIGGLKESRALIIPFVVLATYLVCALISDQVVSIFVGVVDYKELRGITSPCVTLLFFVWIDVSYLTQLNQRIQSQSTFKPILLDP